MSAKPSWVDEFSGPAGSAADPQTWTSDLGGNGWGNGELEYYTASSANVALDGSGAMVITALKSPTGLDCWYGPCRYTSGRIQTHNKVSVTYGHIEARIKVPAGRGTWPAFWMEGTDVDVHTWPACGEIDVMEHIGKEPRDIHGVLHGPGYPSGGGGLNLHYRLPVETPLENTFHVYAIDWDSEGVSFSIDGRVYGRLTRSSTKNKPWVFDHPFFLIINLAIGGRYAGDVDAGTVFPARMVIDYVRVFSRTSSDVVQLGRS